jgi:hypothetical protein
MIYRTLGVTLGIFHSYQLYANIAIREGSRNGVYGGREKKQRDYHAMDFFSQ